ncbi:MAG: hypothetical protein R2762_02245 [Bryobacteraceae bacterium]
MPEGTQSSGPQLPKNSFLRLFVKEIRTRTPTGDPWHTYEPQVRAVERHQHPLAEIADAARIGLGLTPGRPQLLAALAMIDGKIVELAPGAGKTIPIAMAAAYHALRGQSVHVFRRDDVLAHRDAVWMEGLFSELGLTTGYVTAEIEPDLRRQMRRRQILYTTPVEAARDFLHESLAVSVPEPAPETILLADDAEWTLVALASRQVELWSGSQLPPAFARRVTDLVALLEGGLDFDGSEQALQLTDRGLHRMETGLLCSLHDPANQPVLAAVADALSALAKQRSAGTAITVATAPGDGYATTTAVAEGARPEFSGRVLNTITIRTLAARYSRVAGIGSHTGAEAAELSEIYGLDVVPIPSGYGSVRIDQPDLVFPTAILRDRAVAKTTDLEHSHGRPIIIAALSIPQASRLSEMLDTLGVDHCIVSGALPETAADLLSRAGQKGTVTILTPHAPIGIDIPLGDEVPALGGILVLGASRSRFRRMDDYFRGIAARRGLPGETRFYVSLQDEVVTEFGLDGLLQDDGRPDTRAVEDVQWVVQMESLSLVKALARYEDFVEEQRRVLRALRNAVLKGEAATLLGDLDPRLLRRHIARYTERKLAEMERRARIERIDDAWAEYVAWVADYAQARWLSATGLDPLRDFQQEAERTFHALRRGMEEEVTALFDNEEPPVEPPASFDRGHVGSYQLPEPVWARSRERVSEAVLKRLSALGVLEA